MRATGVAVDRGRVLVHTIGPNMTWWALPGGGPEFQEFSSTTLEREMEEELGAAVEVGRLLFVIERAFTSRAGAPAHHIDLAFDMTVLDERVLEKQAPWVGPSPEEYGDLIFHWEPLHSLGQDLPFYPGFLVEALRSPLPKHPVHLTSTT